MDVTCVSSLVSFDCSIEFELAVGNDVVVKDDVETAVDDDAVARPAVD